MNIFYLIEQEICSFLGSNFSYEIKPIYSSQEILGDISIRFSSNLQSTDLITDQLLKLEFIDKIELINGFVNLYIKTNYWLDNLKNIYQIPLNPSYKKILFDENLLDNKEISYDNLLFKYIYVNNKTTMILDKFQDNIRDVNFNQISINFSPLELDLIKLVSYFYKILEIANIKSNAKIITNNLARISDIFIELYYKQDYATLKQEDTNLICKLYITTNVKYITNFIVEGLGEV